MPTNRPFFSNLLVAFRAHGTVSKTASSSNTPQKKTPNTTSSPTASAQVSTATATNASSSSTTTTQQLPVTPRRRSSSSSRGFEPSSGEKWWIGGRNAEGQERFYRLQPVTRQRSFDRLSLDRISV